MPWTAWAALAVPEASRRLAVGRAFVAEAAGALLGFVLANEGGSVEMLYVKRGFRGLGIGKDLLAALGDKPIVARAPTPSWRAWTAKRGIRWRAPDGPPQGIRGQQLGNNARSMAALQVAIDRYEAGEFD
jgi:GNAT superfamily N-acetyltransferase